MRMLNHTYGVVIPYTEWANMSLDASIWQYMQGVILTQALLILLHKSIKNALAYVVSIYPIK